MRVEVKCATGSSESKGYLCPSSESAFSEKVTQSTEQNRISVVNDINCHNTTISHENSVLS